MRRACCLALFGICASGSALADIADTIERVKPSVVVVGTYKKTNSPPFSMRGTGFVAAQGNIVATNAHVLPDAADASDSSLLVVRVAIGDGEAQIRRAQVLALDRDHDLAVLRVEGSPLQALVLKDSDHVREGEAVAFMGFPIGGALGFSPVTHRGMVSAITPIALPGANAQALNEKVIHRLKTGSFNIFQLDGTAYPGNSGSPVFDPNSGDVIGVVNMVFVKATKEAVLSQPSGITYAIPSNFLKELLRRKQ